MCVKEKSEKKDDSINPVIADVKSYLQPGGRPAPLAAAGGGK